MEIELLPDPGSGDPLVEAVGAALAREQLLDDGRPAAYDGTWRRAGLLEATGRNDGAQPAVEPSATGPGPAPRRDPAQAPPARRTRGATRA